jgi:hypothetical protein
LFFFTDVRRWAQLAGRAERASEMVIWCPHKSRTSFNAQVDNLVVELERVYAPDLNPDQLVWSHVKRTGVARNPLRAGEKLELRIEQQLHDVQRNRRLVRSFFGTHSVAYISDC